jgi:hypothetical protein
LNDRQDKPNEKAATKDRSADMARYPEGFNRR